MARDELLDTLSAQKKRAFEYRKLRKEILDMAGREQKSFQPEFERLNSEQTTASGWVSYWNEQLASSRREHSRNGIEYCKGKLQEYRNELSHIREARQVLIFKQRAAKSGFQTALNNFRDAQAECNRLVKACDDRLTELREQNQRARDYRYQQRSRYQQQGSHEPNSDSGQSLGKQVALHSATFLTGVALTLGAQGAVVDPLNPATGADQLGHYTSEQQEQNTSNSVQDGTNDAGNRTGESSKQG